MSMKADKKAGAPEATAMIVAKEMSRKTPFEVTYDQVREVSSDPRMKVYAAQVDDVTVLCWMHQNGKKFVKYVCW